MTAVQVGRLGGGRPLPRAGLGSDRQLLLPGQDSQQKAVRASRDFIIPVGTHWVERDVLMVSEEINRRWPSLLVVSCGCGACDANGHYPHMVVESCEDGRTRPVLGFVEFGRHIIEQLSMAEQTESADLLERMKRDNDLERARRKKASDEKIHEAAEVLGAALASSKQRWKGPNGVVTDPAGKAVQRR